MAEKDAPDLEAELSPRELARVRARDRKRSTRMVVDNGGVKLILQAQQRRAAGRAGDKGTVSAGERSPAGHRTGGQ